MRALAHRGITMAQPGILAPVPDRLNPGQLQCREHRDPRRGRDSPGAGGAMTEGTAPPPSPGGDRRRGEVVSTVAGRPASRAAGQRILVIEDEPEIGQLVEGVLASEGYAVSRARDGEDGLRQALGGG